MGCGNLYKNSHANASAVKLIPENEVSKLNRFILIGPVLWSDSVEDSVMMAHLQELYGDKYCLCKCLHFVITGI